MRWRWGNRLGLGVVSVWAPVLVWAADPPQAPAGAPGQSFRERRVQALATRLQLDEQGRVAVLEILERYASYRQQAHEAFTQRLTELREAEVQEITALLTPEQRVRYDEMRAQLNAQAGQSVGSGLSTTKDAP